MTGNNLALLFKKVLKIRFEKRTSVSVSASARAKAITILKETIILGTAQEVQEAAATL